MSQIYLLPISLNSGRADIKLPSSWLAADAGSLPRIYIQRTKGGDGDAWELGRSCIMIYVRLGNPRSRYRHLSGTTGSRNVGIIQTDHTVPLSVTNRSTFNWWSGLEKLKHLSDILLQSMSVMSQYPSLNRQGRGNLCHYKELKWRFRGKLVR